MRRPSTKPADYEIDDKRVVHIPVEKYTSGRQWFVRLIITGCISALGASFVTGGVFYTTVGKVSANEANLKKKASIEYVQNVEAVVALKFKHISGQLEDIQKNQDNHQKELLELIKKGN